MRSAAIMLTKHPTFRLLRSSTSAPSLLCHPLVRWIIMMNLSHRLFSFGPVLKYKSRWRPSFIKVLGSRTPHDSKRKHPYRCFLNWAFHFNSHIGVAKPAPFLAIFNSPVWKSDFKRSAISPRPSELSLPTPSLSQKPRCTPRFDMKLGSHPW